MHHFKSLLPDNACSLSFSSGKLMNALHVYQKHSQQNIFIEYIMVDKVNDEEPHAHQLGKLLETYKVVTIDVASPEAVVIKELVAKGETVEPGFKIAIISKSGDGVAHVAPLEKISEWAAPKPSLAEKIKRRSWNRAVPQNWSQNLPRVGQFQRCLYTVSSCLLQSATGLESLVMAATEES